MNNRISLLMALCVVSLPPLAAGCTQVVRRQRFLSQKRLRPLWMSTPIGAWNTANGKTEALARGLLRVPLRLALLTE